MDKHLFSNLSTKWHAFRKGIGKYKHIICLSVASSLSLELHNKGWQKWSSKNNVGYEKKQL